MIYIYNDQLTSIDTKCHQKASKLSNAYSIRILPRTTCLQQHKHLKHNGLECAFPFKHGCSLGIYVKFQLGGKLSRYINCGFAWLNPSPGDLSCQQFSNVDWQRFHRTTCELYQKLTGRISVGGKKNESPWGCIKTIVIVNHGVLMDKLPILPISTGV